MQRRGQRNRRRKKVPGWALPAGLALIAVVLVVAILVVRGSGRQYQFAAEEPVSYADLRLNGAPAPEGDLTGGQRGPRNLYLSMPLEKALKTIPVNTEEIQPEDYALLYGEKVDREGTPQPPCALIAVLGEQMQLRIATAPNEQGLYGWIVCDVNPQTGELTAVRWRTVAEMDIVGVF